MSSYKTFLNAVRAAVKKVECKVDGFIKRATDKYNELAYVPIYETPLEDFYTAALETDQIAVGSGFPELEVGKEYLVTIGNVQYKSVARVITSGGETGVYIGSNPLAPRLDDDPYTVLSAAGQGFIAVAETEVGKTMTIQKIGDPVEVGKEWLHDYVDERDDKLTEAVGSAQTTAETAKTTAETAKSTAETAKTTAETAKSTADSAIVLGGYAGNVIDLSTNIPDSHYASERDLHAILCPHATEIGQRAFFGCVNLSVVDIPKATTIRYAAFSHCTGLTSFYIPDGLTNISNNVFFGCDNLSSFEVGDANPSYNSVDGNVYTKDGLTFVMYAIGKREASFNIAEGVTDIHGAAFSGSKLLSVTIPDGVKYIGHSAFSDCTGLTSIALPASLASIVAYAFEECTSLTSITYAGTMERWNAVSKGTGWNEGVPATEVVCSDGSVPLTTTET